MSPKFQALVKILEQERSGGFQDSTVIGGLDRFLQRWSGELKSELGNFRSYSVLTPVERETWTETVLSTVEAPVEARGPRVAAPPTRKRPNRTSASTKRSGSAPHPLRLADDAARLKGVSTHIRSRLTRLGVETVGDLLNLFPRRHNDFTNICKVSELELGKEQTVLVSVWEASETRHGVKRRSTQAVLGDETGNVRAIWFNNPYLVKTLRPNTQLVISGKVNVFKGSFVFESPEYELLRGQEELVHTGRLVPVYPSVQGLLQRTVRRVVKQALEAAMPQVVEYLPDDLRHRTALVGLKTAVSQAHYPDTDADWSAARRRLAFDELFLLQLTVLARKMSWQQDGLGVPLRVDSPSLGAFIYSLPFRLTGAQDRALQEVLRDLSEHRPMSRLLQGDVGSGKTVVAAAALLVAVFNGYQGVLMAPTELLAEQHFLTITNLLSSKSSLDSERYIVSVALEGFSRSITIGLLLGSLSRKAKRELQGLIAEGRVDLVIGTHAVIQEEVELPYLALAVVDEQQRFGVMQRASIRSKGRRPHVLAMSATPIPRSLALTLYGELDISVIDEMPPGRLRIRTRWVAPDKRSVAYNFVHKQVQEARQAFIICPLIQASEVVQTRAAVEEYERLSRDVFPDLRLGLLHGRMSLREKEEVMASFQSADLDVLVSTPVVEVGIDVPNATVMLVDGADRFGLAQLHQFRGRVGRSSHQSYCLLLADSPGEEARERLKIVERIHDGFDLAEEDLRIRGPGDYLGTRQSGLPDLKVARITDHEVLALARQEATRVLETDPGLEKTEHAPLATRMEEYKLGLPGEMS